MIRNKFKSCGKCGSKFRAFNSLQKYCSLSCSKKGVKPKVFKGKGKSKRSKYKFFEEIWNERPHKSQLSGKPLLPKTDFRWHWQFLHVLPHGRFKSLEFEKKNILLALPDEHENQEQYDRFIEVKQELLREYYVKDSTNFNV